MLLSEKGAAMLTGPAAANDCNGEKPGVAAE
jgi:hypothetical protein